MPVLRLPRLMRIFLASPLALAGAYFYGAFDTVREFVTG